MNHPFYAQQHAITPAAIDLLAANNTDANRFLDRHYAGDWSECGEHDAQVNREAAMYGGRILSVYKVTEQAKLWIITEADRSVTTVLLPSDY